jgi:hypothetical protein
MFAMLPRRPDLSAQAFHDHWRHPHGTFGCKISTVRHYVQSHQLPTAYLVEDQSTYEGIVEVWFDNVTDAANLPEHPTYRHYLVPDEPRFVDMDHMHAFFTHEQIIASSHNPQAVTDESDLAWDPDSRSTSIKLIQLFQSEVYTPTSDLITSLVSRLGALRHVFCTPVDEIHPDGAAFSAVRELWWPTFTRLEAGINGDNEAWQRLVGQSGVTSILVQAERFL